MNAVTLYGIAHCDTVKRARAWLAAQGAAVQFHDFKKAGLPAAELDQWLAAAGWQRVLNRKGNTWRALDETQRAAVLDEASAKALMLEHPSLVKRPVLQWRDGSISVGFDADDWARRLAT